MVYMELLSKPPVINVKMAATIDEDSFENIELEDASLSSEVDQVSSPTPVSLSLLKEGYLLRRQHRQSSDTLSRKMIFQRNYIRLTQEALHYGGDHKKQGEFPVDRIKIIQNVPDSTFRRPFCFQIGDDKEIMYFKAKSEIKRNQWLEKLHIAACLKGNTMLDHYHSGAYGQVHENEWSCCNAVSRESQGCLSTTADANGSKYPEMASLQTETCAKMDEDEFSMSLSSAYGDVSSLTLARVLGLKEGYLFKRQRGQSTYSDFRKLIFQQRYICLTRSTLHYYVDEKRSSKRGEFPVDRMRIIVNIPDSTFQRSFCFQVGDENEVMYFSAKSENERKEWIETFKMFACIIGNTMLDNYHPGAYGQVHVQKWSCCNAANRDFPGCQLISARNSGINMFPETASLQTETSVKIDEEVRDKDPEFMREAYIEGYKCVGRSVVGFVYIPDEALPTNVDIRSVSDHTLHPRMSVNEVLLTPVVSVIPQRKLEDKPVIIELMKTAELKAVGEKKIVPMFSNTDDRLPPNWEDLQEECEVLDDRIRFKTTHFSYFAVIARFSHPTASVNVDPEGDGLVKLTVPELPGFTVTIPSKSVQSSTEVKATLYYNNDESDVCKESINKRLASVCVQLEPKGQKFMEKVSVCLPIPGYSEIIAANPGAKLQLMYSPTGSSNDWEIHEDMEVDEVEGHAVATFSTDHFSFWKPVWPENARGVSKAIGTIFNRVEFLRGRCQVFMSHETEVGSVISVGMQALVYPFQDPPYETPCNYRYLLHDSGRLPVRFTPGKLHFAVKLKAYLVPEKGENDQFEKSQQLSHNFAAQPTFDIDIDPRSQLKEGAVIANFLVTNNDGVIEHDCVLIKPRPREDSIVSASSFVTVRLPSKTATTKLSNQSLKDITTHLWPARLKWRQIGIALGIDATTLEVIEEDHRRVDDRFLAVLLEWLKNAQFKPCWKVLAEALSSPPVGVTVEEAAEDESRHSVVSTTDSEFNVDANNGTENENKSLRESGTTELNKDEDNENDNKSLGDSGTKELKLNKDEEKENDNKSPGDSGTKELKLNKDKEKEDTNKADSGDGLVQETVQDQSRSNIRVQSDNYELKSEDNEIQYHVTEPVQVERSKCGCCVCL